MSFSIQTALTTKPCCSLDVTEDEQARLVKMFKALGNPTRFEILKYMLTHPGCITADVVNAIPLAQATVSQHLKVLREAGWVHSEDAGPATMYCTHNDNIAWFRTKIEDIF